MELVTNLIPYFLSLILSAVIAGFIATRLTPNKWVGTYKRNLSIFILAFFMFAPLHKFVITPVVQIYFVTVGQSDVEGVVFSSEVQCPPAYDVDATISNGIAINKELLEARTLYENSKFEEAFEIFKPHADHGNVIAQYYLGIMYSFGLGIPRDTNKAVSYYIKSASNRYAPSQMMLGLLYAHGDWGIQKNLAKAKDLFLQSANQNYPGSQYKLGQMLIEGVGTQKNYSDGIKWLKKAALLGHSEAQRDLGSQIYTNKKSSDDILEARKWLYCSATYGDREAMYNLAIVHMTEGRTINDFQTAYMYLYIAAEGGYESAKDILDKVAVELEVHQIAEAENTAIKSLSDFKQIWKYQAELSSHN